MADKVEFPERPGFDEFGEPVDDGAEEEAGAAEAPEATINPFTEQPDDAGEIIESADVPERAEEEADVLAPEPPEPPEDASEPLVAPEPFEQPVGEEEAAPEPPNADDFDDLVDEQVAGQRAAEFEGQIDAGETLIPLAPNEPEPVEAPGDTRPLRERQAGRDLRSRARARREAGLEGAPARAAEDDVAAEDVLDPDDPFRGDDQPAPAVPLPGLAPPSPVAGGAVPPGMGSTDALIGAVEKNGELLTELVAAVTSMSELLIPFEAKMEEIRIQIENISTGFK